MKAKNEKKITYPNYRAIRELSHRIDCAITQADFDTSHPNPYRVAYAACDINRYLKNFKTY